MLFQTAMPPALRRWSTALVALVGLWLLVPSTVEAQRRARLDTQLGAEIMQDTETGETVARPVTRLQLAVEAAGPLEIGVYLQAVARELPLKSPGFGGGLSFALRPEIEALRLRPLLQASAGYAALPGGQMRSVGALDVSLTGGLAVELTDFVAVEVRASHHWRLGLPDAATLRHRAWSATGGLSFTWE